MRSFRSKILGHGAGLVGALLSAALAVGCGRSVHLGQLAGDGSGDGGTLLWTATFEPGDLSEWDGDGEGGTYREGITTDPIADKTRAHTGIYAGRSRMSPPPTGSPSANYFYREGPRQTEAYYSAWYYIPGPVTVPKWLSIIHLNGSKTGDGQKVFPTWDLNLYTQFDGNLVAHLWDYTRLINTEASVSSPVPVNDWVHFEMFFRKATDDTGRVTIWQDGVMIIDVQKVSTVVNDWMQWNVGGSSADITPSPAVIYLDDAAISLTRVGPSR